MGRELKRVPLDFEWPLKEIWWGFLNPFYKYHLDCPSCNVSGYSPWAKDQKEKWQGYHREDWEWIVPGKSRYNKAAGMYNFTEEDLMTILKSGSFDELIGRRVRYEEDTDTWWEWQGNGKDSKKVTLDGPPPLPKLEEALEWAIRSPFWSANSAGYYLIIEKAKRERREWKCPQCSGEGRIWASKDMKEKSEAWEETPIPTGPGYQLWETTSEGSPVSPVFKDLDSLCAWCEKSATTFGSEKTSKEEWKRMLNDDMVCHREGNMIFI